MTNANGHGGSAPVPNPIWLAERKRQARLDALSRRAGCDPALGALLIAPVLEVVPRDAVVGGFWPLPGEIDLRPVLDALNRRGHQLALPRTPKRGRPLSFHRWQPGEPLSPGRFGTVHPETDEILPDLLLTPLLAFDAEGRRLGYGGGYYDRTLAAHPELVAIGCAFAAQQADELPAGPQDARLHAVVTERGLMRFGREG